MTTQLKTRLTSAVYDAALQHAQRAADEGKQTLKVSGKVSVDVRLIVDARVMVDFYDVELANHESLELRVDDNGYHVVATGLERDSISTYDLADTLSEAGFDAESETDNFDLDEFDTIEIARVEHAEVDDVMLDHDSDKALTEWNEAADEES